jgi:opine dehydrogenase
MGVNSVAVLGAGHGGCAAAADLGKRGYSVRLHARNPERLAPLRAQGGIEARRIQQGLVQIDLLTTDVAEAVRGADLIMFSALPSNQRLASNHRGEAAGQLRRDFFILQ